MGCVGLKCKSGVFYFCISCLSNSSRHLCTLPLDAWVTRIVNIVLDNAYLCMAHFIKYREKEVRIAVVFICRYTIQLYMRLGVWWWGGLGNDLLSFSQRPDHRITISCLYRAALATMTHRCVLSLAREFKFILVYIHSPQAFFFPALQLYQMLQR